ncbi:hypothetical protein S245_003411, partial [Arachis hypogaea]
MKEPRSQLMNTLSGPAVTLTQRTLRVAAMLKLVDDSEEAEFARISLFSKHSEMK